ncbi:uncharacterized protein B0H18DRAFT_1112487 [Fomitopsis serialis]|uniref:uncharacterized protein n=1 Tax=Fomitopsis serialis TaxID=139415 RepID=UPI00200720F9|nr:uncharacterized protein B0H18DRAFT_1112487 [Neoantrodia serialis]KAH9938314.1 hypothetical protein B0H18DRAFT_1112487 [Neoantrodia serialis]
MNTNGATLSYPTPAVSPTPSAYSSQAVSPPSISTSSTLLSVTVAPSSPPTDDQPTEPVASSSTSNGPPPACEPPATLSLLEETGLSTELWEALISEAEAHAQKFVRDTTTALPSPPSTPSPPVEANDQQERVPRARNCFVIFRQCVSKATHLPNALKKNQKHLSKVLGSYWRALPEARKQIFRHAQAVDMEAHRRKYPGYKYKPAPKAAKKPVQKRYAQSVAAAGSSFASERKGKAKATSKRGVRGVAADHIQHSEAELLPVPPPQVPVREASVAVPPTLPSVRWPTASYALPPDVPQGWSYSPSTFSPWQNTAPRSAPPMAYQPYWQYAPMPVPAAPVLEPAPSEQMWWEDPDMWVL